MFRLLSGKFILTQSLVLVILVLLVLPCLSETKIIEGKVSKQNITETKQQNTKVLKSAISKDYHKNVDVQVLKVNFYYHPDADIYYELLKQEGQKQYPHLLGYREIDGLYRKALSKSEFEEVLTEWRRQGGPMPYFINIGAKIRNNGSGAMTDVKIRFDVEVKVGQLRAKPSTLTTDYKDLYRNSRWQKWFTKTINIKVLPPGEYKEVHTEDFSLCSLFEKLKDKWPETIRVKVNAYAAMDGIKNNNYGFKSLPLIPDHFVIKNIH